MSEIVYAVADGVAVITLNRPEARNALNAASFDGLRSAFHAAVDDAEVRAVVLTGAGGSFCSGMDLKAFARGEKIDGSGLPFSRESPLPFDKPLIAAVEGHCLAGGFEIALACDLLVAASDTRFGLPEVKRGLAAAGGGLVRLPRQAPWRIAMELILTGAMEGVERLERVGLINRVTAPGEALAGATALAKTIAENGPLAVAASKRVMCDARDWTIAQALDRQGEFLDPVFASADAREGATAFAEKRPPVWRGV